MPFSCVPVPEWGLLRWPSPETCWQVPEPGVSSGPYGQVMCQGPGEESLCSSGQAAEMPVSTAICLLVSVCFKTSSQLCIRAEACAGCLHGRQSTRPVFSLERALSRV